MSAFRYHADLTNCILYTTAPPCHKRAQMIVQSGIKTVVHGKKQREVESRGGAEGGSEENDEEDEEVSAEEIFYWAKVATL